MDNTAFATGTPMARGSGFDEEQEKRQKVLDGLKNKSSSPDGAASQEGALGTPASAGDNSPAFMGEGEGGTGKDMVAIFMESSDEDKDNLTKKTQEAMAPGGKSLEGGFMDILKQGGPQAMARAGQFGIDLEPWAAKLNPQQQEVALGQAMGNIPSDENAGKEAFKTTGAALSDNKAATKKSADQAAAKKKDQLNAIAAFMTETGLRLLASNRPTAEAFGQSALGTIDSTRKRNRLAANDKMQADETERQRGREDKADSRAVAKEAREEAKFGVDKLVKITNPDGEVFMYDPTDESKGKYVKDKDGNKVLSEDVGLSQNAIFTHKRNFLGALNGKIEKMKGMDSYERETLYPELKGLKGQKLRSKMEELAKAEMDSQGYDENPQSSTDVRDWDSMS